jgi:hypothetical protein
MSQGIDYKLPSHQNNNNNPTTTTAKLPSKKYDACFVFEIDTAITTTESTSPPLFSPQAEEIIRKLIVALGLDNMIFYKSVDQGEIILLISLSEERAAYLSDLKNYKLLTNEDKLRERAQLGWPADSIKHSPVINPLQIDMTERPDITVFRPFQEIYLQYKMENEFQNLYKLDPYNDSVFSSTMRLKILHKLLVEPEDAGGLDLKFTKLTAKGPNGEKPVAMAIFALHNPPALAELKNMLSSSRYPWSYNYTMLKDYLGEKSALYYKFVGHYAFWLTGPAIVGLGFEIGVIVTQKTGNASIPFYSLLVVLWGVFMLEYWKREEKFTALAWGTLGFEDVENIRAEFTDYEKVDLTGEQVLYFSPDKKRVRVSISFLIIIILCIVVVGTVALIYIIRGALARENASAASASAVVASVLNAIQIQVYGSVYNFMAQRLTDRENHKTDTQYEDR